MNRVSHEPTSKQQRGIVALLTVVFASILFTIVVVGMVAIISNQEHQASEADLSNRAYFAAENGLEKGILDVKNALNTCTLYQIQDATTAIPDTCATLKQYQCLSGPINAASGANYTCLYLSNKTTNLTHDLSAADADSWDVDLSGISDINKIVISWNQPTSGDSPNYALVDPGLVAAHSEFTSKGAWPNPAVIELQSILFPTGGGAINPNNITSGAQLKLIENTLVPTSATNQAIVSEDDTNASPNVPDATIPAVCAPSGTTPTGGYSCSATITMGNGTPNYQRILRLHARYAGANVGLQVYDSSGTLIPVPDSYETIDVTAKSGNTYRRVYSKVALTQSTVALDYALFSDTDLCHDFELRDAYSGNKGNGNGFDNAGSCPF